MDIRNCSKCGKIYAYNGLKYCPNCLREEEENYQRVKEYVYDNKDATIHETSEATGVPVRKIIDYLRQGRLELKGENSNMLLDCERCGRPISTGRFCVKCASELEKQFKSSYKHSKKTTAEKEQDKMYVADRHKRKN